MYFRQKIKEVLMVVCNTLAFVSRKKELPAILMYHSFDSQEWRYGISPEMLKKQFQYLLKRRTIVSLEEIISYVKEERNLPGDAVAITVDDVYEDTYTVLFPLITKYKIPVTLFLTTDLSEQPKLGNLPRSTWEQIKTMSDSKLVSVQVHGHSHTNFPKVIEGGFEESEIERCRKIIEEELNCTVKYVAYPAGRYNQQVIKYFRDNEYEAGFIAQMGIVRRGDDLFRLRRIGVDRNTSMKLFKNRLMSGMPMYLYIVHTLKKVFLVTTNKINNQ